MIFHIINKLVNENTVATWIIYILINIMASFIPLLIDLTTILLISIYLAITTTKTIESTHKE